MRNPMVLTIGLIFLAYGVVYAGESATAQRIAAIFLIGFGSSATANAVEAMIDERK